MIACRVGHQSLVGDRFLVGEIRPDATDSDEAAMPPRIRLPDDAPRWNMRPASGPSRPAILITDESELESES
jgi:hypothetical protein